MRANQPTKNEDTEPVSTEPVPTEPVPTEPEPVEQSPIKPDRTKEIIEKATELYDTFRASPFSRDSFIELGESIKLGKTFKQVHPVVQRIIMKMAKTLHRID